MVNSVDNNTLDSALGRPDLQPSHPALQTPTPTQEDVDNHVNQKCSHCMIGPQKRLKTRAHFLNNISTNSGLLYKDK
ncbi:hypothetical protein Pmar_PMAR007439 [Perkinsus marinus ATCC 50983]|uniref:Uncharacterized protein n=1 Tax=Perkinsus marinus (strain ATCC 50983 / TXsc) TaxID=423536 RepID=C5L975_PERM5|nr:hypothetical protein Pmar_PMAR007439 [Perkinsus marinus ATCC 50983]EER06723.1 hypothetical protein Pmar_PMAR007439 [Perkinsus marinus ATCC 50983]|eukprot:XP_002774907.1 hypothetical protein Pmar_PMAR007439 [Perkinsus marinus ATCC 50983]